MRVSPQTTERLEKWAADSCAVHKLTRGPDGTATLWAQRPESRSSKSMKVMLRTVFANWKSPLQDLGPDWLVLLSPEEFASALQGHHQQKAAPLTKPPVTASPPRDVGQTLTALSEGFDQRSWAAWEAITCAG